jgi:conjugative transfer ATPase
MANIFQLFAPSLATRAKGPSLDYKPDQWKREHGEKGDVNPPTESRMRDMYHRPPSFTNLLPWCDYDAATQAFLLEDGRSVSALFELRPATTDARPELWMREFRDKIQAAISSLPETDPPWVVQFFMQDERRLESLADQVEKYAHPDCRDSVFTQDWLALLREHLSEISQPEGLFVDEKITGEPWRGRLRRVRMTLYRRRRAAPLQYGELGAEAELEDVANRLVSSLKECGVVARRRDGRHLYEWLFRWFNPHPQGIEGDTETLLRMMPYPGDDRDDRPFGYDFAERLMQGLPAADPRLGVWWFDDVPHRAVTLHGLSKLPAIGQIASERLIGDHVFAAFDRMPENAILSMTVTVRPQDLVRNHLAKIEKASFGDYAEARLAAQDAKEAQMEIAKGNKLFPLQTVFFVRGGASGDREANLNDLRQKTQKTNSLLLSNHLQPIQEAMDLVALDLYIRALPMAYDPDFDKRETKRSRFCFARHIANLAPVYGRSTGTGKPGLTFFNRGGEPLIFDPIKDRKSNAHALILGPTGAGKSALLAYVTMQMMAVHRPRLFIVEAGGSFSLLGQYFASLGIGVNQVAMKPGEDVSLPPFADALKLFDARGRRRFEPDEARAWDGDDDATEDADDSGDGARDYLGEMEIVARLMITGGDAREDNRLTRADRWLIQQAIILAARRVGEAGGAQVLTEDIERALRELAEERPSARGMADALGHFCTPGSLAAHFFNRPGKLWPDADVTIFEMGVLAKDGYEDKLAVAYVSLMNHIHALVEREQYSGRPTLALTDEAHLITTNPLLAPYVVKISKMWRKYGAWLWLATQNMQDFPDAAKRMLNMMEWWICMAMPPEEIEHIARFRDLTDEERALLLAASKEPGKYAEGVVLGPSIKALFRNVPPALALALAMTDPDEKAERARIMKERGCTELEAAKIVARRIAQERKR